MKVKIKNFIEADRKAHEQIRRELDQIQNDIKALMNEIRGSSKELNERIDELGKTMSLADENIVGALLNQSTPISRDIDKIKKKKPGWFK